MGGIDDGGELVVGERRRILGAAAFLAAAAGGMQLDEVCADADLPTRFLDAFNRAVADSFLVPG